jgi:hypothetical protein
MRVLMAQFKIKQDALQKFEAARDKILAALARKKPKGLRYTWCAMPDGMSFVGWLELDETFENPLVNMEAATTISVTGHGTVTVPSSVSIVRVYSR